MPPPILKTCQWPTTALRMKLKHHALATTFLFSLIACDSLHRTSNSRNSEALYSQVLTVVDSAGFLTDGFYPPSPAVGSCVALHGAFLGPLEGTLPPRAAGSPLQEVNVPGELLSTTD